MLETPAATESEMGRKATIETATLESAMRDEFETIWRVAGLPPGDLSRHPDGTYEAPYATRAWGSYAATKDWRVVLAAAKLRG